MPLSSPPAMCDYIQVEYNCSHVRYTVRAWCTEYVKSHVRCPPNVVAVLRRPYVRRGRARTDGRATENIGSTRSAVRTKGNLCDAMS